MTLVYSTNEMSHPLCIKTFTSLHYNSSTSLIQASDHQSRRNKVFYHMFFFLILLFVNLVISRFVFLGGIWVLGSNYSSSWSLHTFYFYSYRGHEEVQCSTASGKWSNSVITQMLSADKYTSYIHICYPG